MLYNAAPLNYAPILSQGHQFEATLFNSYEKQAKREILKMKKLAVMAAAAVLAMSANVNAFNVDSKYKQACAACHGMGVAGAPKAFDAAAWKARLDTGMDKMVAAVTNGKGAMPPKGLCNSCTADQFKDLINYMAAPKQ